MNFLEELAAEWYSYIGFFVRRDIKHGKLPHGGWKGEADVLAYRPSDRTLIHVEPSGDSHSWPVRRRTYLEKKFVLSKRDYRKLIGAPVSRIEKIALVGWTSSAKKENVDWPGIKVVLIPNFLAEIVKEMSAKDPSHEVMSEDFPLLRAIQIATSKMVQKRLK
jgi:hypothetical protein